MLGGYASMYFGHDKNCACGEPGAHFKWIAGMRVTSCETCYAAQMAAEAEKNRIAILTEYEVATKALSDHRQAALICIFGTSAEGEAWRTRAAVIAARAQRAEAAARALGLTALPP